MSKKVSPIPRGYRTATACLTVRDIDAAVAFYQAAFGAELLNRQTGMDESSAVHATIKIGNSMIALNPEMPELGIFAPVTLGGSVGQIHLYVDAVDASWERAVEAGAIVRAPLYDAYWGDRTGTLADGNGHLWSLASKIENVSQDEIARRARAWYGVSAAEAADLPPEASDPGAEIPAEAQLPEMPLAQDSLPA